MAWKSNVPNSHPGLLLRTPEYSDDTQSVSQNNLVIVKTLQQNSQTATLNDRLFFQLSETWSYFYAHP